MENVINDVHLPICVLHKRLAETYTNNNWWCTQCMDEIISPTGWYVQRMPDGIIYITGQIEEDWELLSSAIPFSEARTLQIELEEGV